MISALLFVASVAIGVLGLDSPAARESMLGFAVVLALLALRLITKPPIGRWPMRAR